MVMCLQSWRLHTLQEAEGEWTILTRSAVAVELQEADFDLQMKCEFKKNENTCKRCQSGGHVCIVEGRKPRTAPK